MIWLDGCFWRSGPLCRCRATYYSEPRSLCVCVCLPLFTVFVMGSVVTKNSCVILNSLLVTPVIISVGMYCHRTRRWFHWMRVSSASSVCVCVCVGIEDYIMIRTGRQLTRFWSRALLCLSIITCKIERRTRKPHTNLHTIHHPYL